MATQLGNTTKNYGQKHNYVVTNLNGEAIMKSSDLLENTFIVSSPSNVAKTDIGTYSMFVTDSNGNPVRLSYTIQPGRGLVIGRSGHPETSGDGIDVISMAIDDYSIKTHPQDQYLYVQCYNIIDNYTLTTSPYGLVGDYMRVVTENLDKATNDTWGVVRSSDPRTAVQIDEGELSIITEKLDYVDDDLNVNGIVRCQSDDAADLGFRTVEAQNGRLHVITKNLDKPTKEYCGVVKADDFIEPDSNGLGGQAKTTTILRDGSIHVVNYTYTYSYVNSYGITYQGHGIVAPDNKTTITEKPGIMSVDTAGLVHASEKEYGTVKVDGDSTLIDSKGLLTVGYWGKITTVLRDFNPSIQKIWDKLAEYENRIAWLEAQAMAEKIYSFVSRSGNMTTLTEPVWEANLNSDIRENVTLYTRSGERPNYTYAAVTSIDELDSTLIYYKYAAHEAEFDEDKNAYFDYAGNEVTTIVDGVHTYYTYDPANRAATSADYETPGNTYDYIIAGGITSIDQEFSVEFAVSTNCMFKVSVDYEDNVSPAVTLQSVKFQSDIDVAASGLTEFTFDSTDGNEQTLKFSFRARNYNSDTSESETVTRVTFLVTSTNDSTIYKTGSHAFKRFNEKAYMQENGDPIPVPDPVYPKDPTDWEVDYITNITFATSNEEVPNFMTPVPYGTIGSYDIAFNAEGHHTRKEYDDSTDEEGHDVSDTFIIDNPEIDYNLEDENGWKKGTIAVNVEYFKPGALIQAALAHKEPLSGRFVAQGFERIDTDTTNNNSTTRTTYYEVLSAPLTGPKTSGTDVVSGNTLRAAPLGVSGTNTPASSQTFTTTTAPTSAPLSPSTPVLDGGVVTDTELSTLGGVQKRNSSSNTATFETFMPIQTTYTQGTSAYVNARSMLTSRLEFSSVTNWVPDNGANWLNASITTTYEQTGTYTLLHLQSNGAIIDDRCAKVTLQYKTPAPDNYTGDDADEDGFIIVSKSFYYTEQYVENKPNLNVTANLNNIGDPLTFTITRSPNSRLTGECYDENGNPVAQYWGATVTFNYVANLSKQPVKTSNGSLSVGDDITTLNGGTMPRGNANTFTPTGSNTRGNNTFTRGGSGSMNYSPASLVTTGVNLAPHTIYLQGNRSENSITFSYEMSESDKAIRGTNSLTSVVISYVTTESFTYAGGPNITYSVNGGWNASQAGMMSSSYTFGNAKIQNVTINKWDDAEMLITFDIKPGTTTNIPSNMRSGTVISEILMSDHGTRDIKFMIGNSTYDWDCFYSHCTFSASDWTAYGCTVTYRLWNRVSATQNAQTPFRQVVCTFRNANNQMSFEAPENTTFNAVRQSVDRMYTDNNYAKLATMPAYTNRLNVANVELVSGPMLNNFNYIKFWFSLNAEWYTNVEQTVVCTVGTKFEVSLVTLSNKYGSASSAIMYSNGGVIPVNLVNALYTSNSTSNNNTFNASTIDEAAYNEIVDTLSDLTDKYNTIQSGSAVTGGALNVNNNPVIGNAITGGSSNNSNQNTNTFSAGSASSGSVPRNTGNMSAPRNGGMRLL